jgi:hypothetical protein
VRALERAGYGVVRGDAAVSTRIEIRDDGGRPEWRMQSDGGAAIHRSLEALVATLRSYDESR